MKIRRPTQEELQTCSTVELTDSMPWHPELQNDKPTTEEEYDNMMDLFEENLRSLNPIVIWFGFLRFQKLTD